MFAISLNVRPFNALLGALLVSCIASVATAAEAPPHNAVPVRFVEQPGVLEFSERMIVHPFTSDDLRERGVDASEADGRAGDAVLEILALVDHAYDDVGDYVVDLPVGETESSFATRLMASGNYKYVEPDWIAYPLITPNDTFYGNQWHHPVIHSPEAWDLLTGSDQVTCAFVDTGIDVDHPDLASHRVPGYNSAGNRAEVDGGNIDDINGHGTAVSGTAAAIGNNGMGVAGVGWNQRIMMVRTTNNTDGSASMSDILEGARWGASHGARVVSASYSGVGNASVNETGRWIRQTQDALFVYAAGNSNTNLASFDHKFVVVSGATTTGDAKAGFSSYGRAVDCYAPGVNIWTTRNGGGYGGVSGTSFSTPMTNGIISMIWSVDLSFTADQVELILFHTCDDLGDPGEDEFWGFGRVNVFRAVQLAQQVSAGNVPPVVMDDHAVTIGAAPVEVDVTKNDFDFNMDLLTISDFDAVTPAGNDVALSLGSGPGGRDELIFSTAGGFVGIDTFSYTMFDGSETASASVTVEVFDPAEFRVPENPAIVEPGLRDAYYEIPALDALPDFDALTPYQTGITENIAFNSTPGQFAFSGRYNRVGAVFEGFIDIPEPARYTLYTNSNDGSRLWIGDQLVVNNDGVHTMREVGGQISLFAGKHAMRVEFFERAGEAGLIVSIESAAMEKQVVPRDMLIHDTCPDVDGDGFVTLGDLAVVLANFGSSSGVTRDDGDLNGDGVVDLADLALILQAFGQPCQ